MTKILVADDNSNIQKMVSLALQDQGIEVVAVGNGEAAVRKMSDVLPDLVLADIFMPVRNGYEVCEFVKHDPRFSHTPVILLVGAFDPLDEQEAQRVGADGVLKKPFVPPDPLVSMVKTALAKANSQRLTPVGVVSEKATSMGAPAAAPPPPPEFRPEPEPPMEPFAKTPERFAFREGEKPVAFGELLETPQASASAGPTVTGPIDTGMDEHPFGKFPAAGKAAEEQEDLVQEALPRRDDAALLRARESLVEEVAPSTPEKRAEPETPLGTLPDLVQSADDWLTNAATHPPAPLPTTEEDSWVAAPTVETAPPLAAPPPSEAAAPASEPAATGSTGRVHEETRKSSDYAAHSWPAAPPTPMWESARPAHESPPSLTPTHEEISKAVSSFELPKQPDPALVDAVVARVLERMQPQIMDVVTKEILRPVVEALVRRELEKH